MAMISVILVRRSAQLPGYCVVNFLVHPDFRGQNIFGRMIASAIEMVASENAVLVGYPNDMALKFWQRAAMHFQTPLRPCLVAPSLPAKGVRAREITDIESLKPSLAPFEEQALQGESWRPSFPLITSAGGISSTRSVAIEVNALRRVRRLSDS